MKIEDCICYDDRYDKEDELVEEGQEINTACLKGRENNWFYEYLFGKNHGAINP